MKLILTALLALFCASASAADAKRPNIVVFSPFWQQIIKGFVILGAVALDKMNAKE